MSSTLPGSSTFCTVNLKLGEVFRDLIKEFRGDFSAVELAHFRSMVGEPTNSFSNVVSVKLLLISLRGLRFLMSRSCLARRTSGWHMNGRSSRLGSWTFLDRRFGSNLLLIDDDRRPFSVFLAVSYRLMLVDGLLVTGRLRGKLRNEVL